MRTDFGLITQIKLNPLLSLLQLMQELNSLLSVIHHIYIDPIIISCHLGAMRGVNMILLFGNPLLNSRDLP
jgi:hypothetical protein